MAEHSLYRMIMSQGEYVVRLTQTVFTDLSLTFYSHTMSFVRPMLEKKYCGSHLYSVLMQ